MCSNAYEASNESRSFRVCSLTLNAHHRMRTASECPLITHLDTAGVFESSNTRKDLTLNPNLVGAWIVSVELSVRTRLLPC